MGWKNLAEKRAYDRAWREKNREKIRKQSCEYARKRRAADLNYGKAATKRYVEKNRNELNAKQRLKRTGCTPEQYAQALIDQNNTCVICKQPFVGDMGLFMACADHDHVTMKFRGLLHQKCNRGLGHFNDDPILLASAIDYLNRFKVEE